MTPPRTEREKMLAGELYLAADPELTAARLHARRLMHRFNHSDPADQPTRDALLQNLVGRCGSRVFVEPPFYCDYGQHITLHDDVYCNFGCVLLDCNTIEIGPQTMLAPNVQLYAAYHPIDPDQRVAGPELAAPIRIGEKVWLGGGAIVLPGVTIGDSTTIGAGSVVTRNMPSRVVAAGNPCRVLRTL